MNYIQTLQARVRETEEQVNRARAEIADLRALLLSPKHQGTAADGSRNDWIASADVLARLSLIEQALTE